MTNENVCSVMLDSEMVAHKDYFSCHRDYCEFSEVSLNRREYGLCCIRNYRERLDPAQVAELGDVDFDAGEIFYHYAKCMGMDTCWNCGQKVVDGRCDGAAFLL